MKYIVMECHEGYAVLMDEESRFVNAANMHYKVGQTVTDPILMNESSKDSHRSISMIIGRVAAAAACIALLTGGGYNYYSRNLKVDSTILISSKANITISMNKKGNVIDISYDSKEGEDVVKNYNAKGKDKLTVTNEIIEIEKSKGYIPKGGTVDLYVSTEKSEDYDEYKSQVENSVADSDVKINVIDAARHEAPVQTQPAAPKPSDPAPANIDAAKPAPEAALVPDKPVAPPDDKAAQSGNDPAPPAPPAELPKDNNEPPAPADVHPAAPEPPKPHNDAAETPAKPDNSEQAPAAEKPEVKEPEAVKPVSPEDNAAPHQAPVPEPDVKAAPEIILMPKPGIMIAENNTPEPKKEITEPAAPEPVQDIIIQPDAPANAPAETEDIPHHPEPALPNRTAAHIHSDAIKPIE